MYIRKNESISELGCVKTATKMRLYSFSFRVYFSGRKLRLP